MHRTRNEFVKKKKKIINSWIKAINRSDFSADALTATERHTAMSSAK